MILGSTQPMWFSLSSTTKSLPMNWMTSDYYLKRVLRCIWYDNWWYTLCPTYGVRIGESQQGRHLPATYLTRPSRHPTISPDHLASHLTLWPGRTGSALAWLKMLINEEIEEEEPIFSRIMFHQGCTQRGYIWPKCFNSASMSPQIPVGSIEGKLFWHQKADLFFEWDMDAEFEKV